MDENDWLDWRNELGEHDSYYRTINEEVKNRLGGLHSAKIVLYSVEFDEIERCQSSGDWEKSGDILRRD